MDPIQTRSNGVLGPSDRRHRFPLPRRLAGLGFGWAIFLMQWLACAHKIKRLTDSNCISSQLVALLYSH